MRHRRTVLLSLLLMPLWAIVATAVLETPLWWHETNHALAVVAVLSKPLDVLFVLMVLLLLWCLTGRLWLSMGLLLGLTAGLSAINVAKMSILTEPLFPSDYQFLNSTGFLLDMVTAGAAISAVVGLLGVAIASVLATRVASRRYPRVRKADHPRGWAVLVGTRVVGTVVLLFALASAVHFNDRGNPWRKLYEANGAIWQPFSQAKNYRTNGFVGGALYNMPSEPMPRPSGYNTTTMAEVAQRYADRAAARNVGRIPGAIEGVNVVLVLSEAFADLTKLKDVEVARDTMPLTRETIGSSWGGSTLANTYGTGTSGMEFEALTGQTLGLFNPQVVAPYQNFMTGMSGYPSAVGWFAEHGHVPIAVHPYHEEFYRRDTIYPMLGFRDFVFDKSIRDKERLQHSDYISDRAAFHEVEEQLERHDEPLLVNLVTMQNHVPTAGSYDDPVPVEAPGDPELVESVGQYARGQEYTDEALRDFLENVQASPEPTVVVFYGDHYPGVLPNEVLDANPGRAHLETPMFIWSSEGQTARPLAVTSPATFLPYVFDLVGEPLPPYYELLSEVAEHIGAISPGRIVAPDGSDVSETDLTSEQQQLLHDYRLVQYDFSIGQRYAVDSMFYDFDNR
jgi:phosphoglycerol transferase MdoB-like AlkP superfamily enzyme